MYKVQLRQVLAITTLSTVSLSSFPRNLKVRASDTLNQILQDLNLDYTNKIKLKTIIDKIHNLTKFYIFFSFSFKPLMT